MGDQNQFEDELIWLAELVGTDGELRDVTFLNCRITGPAVIVPIDSVIQNSNLGAPLDHVLWRVPRDRAPFVGAIVAFNCTFDGCTFVNIAFAGSPKFLAGLRASVG